jgi:hypothetical protein
LSPVNNSVIRQHDKTLNSFVHRRGSCAAIDPAIAIFPPDPSLHASDLQLQAAGMPLMPD